MLFLLSCIHDMTVDVTAIERWQWAKSKAGENLASTDLSDKLASLYGTSVLEFFFYILELPLHPCSKCWFGIGHIDIFIYDGALGSTFTVLFKTKNLCGICTIFLIFLFFIVSFWSWLWLKEEKTVRCVSVHAKNIDWGVNKLVYHCDSCVWDQERDILVQKIKYFCWVKTSLY